MKRVVQNLVFFYGILPLEVACVTLQPLRGTSEGKEPAVTSESDPYFTISNVFVKKCGRGETSYDLSCEIVTNLKPAKALASEKQSLSTIGAELIYHDGGGQTRAVKGRHVTLACLDQGKDNGGETDYPKLLEEIEKRPNRNLPELEVGMGFAPVGYTIWGPNHVLVLRVTDADLFSRLDSLNRFGKKEGKSSRKYYFQIL